MADAPVTTKEVANGQGDQVVEKMDIESPVVKEEGETIDPSSKTKKDKGKEKVRPKPKNDKVAKMGLVGQEAIKMRRELRAKRKEEYKKSLEKTCTFLHVQSLGRVSGAHG
jgi:U1 small nuclear ribonucleoprotein